MFRMWAKIIKDNHLLKDTVIVIEDSDMTRTHKVFQALDDICHTFDLPVPIWLDTNVEDFKIHSKCRFTQDSFIEEIPFDYLEIHIIEE